ncbi:MAG: heme-binding protein [Sphingomonadales bacterium]|nr:heme-binding protein [Sphingomonadales bacterium]
MRGGLLMLAALAIASPATAGPAPIDAAEAHAIPAPPYGAAIGLDAARRMADAARARAVAMGFPACTIAIAGPDGSLILFEKMDGETFVSVEFAIAKARTAAISRRATGPAPGGAMTAPLPDLIALPGGLPIIAGGHTLGGIGISGTDGGDVAIAEAALAAL